MSVRSLGVALALVFVGCKVPRTAVSTTPAAPSAARAPEAGPATLEDFHYEPDGGGGHESPGASQPPVYGTKTDGYPDEVHLRATILDLNWSAYCGVLALTGSLRLRVDHAEPAFPRSEIIVLCPCLTGTRERLVGKTLTLTARKLYPSRASLDELPHLSPAQRRARMAVSRAGADGEMAGCYYGLTNTFSSGGAPFYCTPELVHYLPARASTNR